MTDDPADATKGAPRRPDAPLRMTSPADAAGPTVALDDGYPRPSAGRRRGLRGLLPAPIWQVGRLLLLALIIEYLVVPQLAGPRKVAHLLTQVNPLLLLAGVGLEAGALVCYAQLTRTVLPGSNRLSLFTLQRIQLSTLSVSHCAPGGSATGTALGYRLMTQAGLPRSDVGFALAMQGIGSGRCPQLPAVVGAHHIDPVVGLLRCT